MRQFAGVLVLLTILPALRADEVRTWTDSQGRKMQAQFVREVDGDVTFIKDGKLTTFPLDQLSEEDQKFIRESETNKKVEETTLPAGAPRKDTGADSLLTPAPPSSADDAKSSLTKQKIAAEERTWRDFRGRQTVGKFVRMNDGNVVLLRGGRVVSLPFYTLSRQDREYVHDLLAARGETSQLPILPPDEPTLDPQPASTAGPNAGTDGEPGSELRGNGNTNRQQGGNEPATEQASTAPKPTPDTADRLAMSPAEISIPSVPPPTATKRERPPLTPAAVGVVIVFFGISLAIGSAIGAVILRAAISLYNSMAGGADSESGVPEPAFSEAMGITFATWLVNGITGFVVGLVVGMGGLAADWGEQETRIASQLVSMPLGFVVMVSMLSSMLPTTIGRAILITICYMLVSLLVFGILIAIALVVWGATMSGAN